MKIDKKQSLKNKIGMVAFGTFLALSLTPAKANEQKNNIKVNYTDYITETGKHEIAIIQRENKNDIILPKYELDYLLHNSDNNIIEINGEMFSKQELENAIKNKKSENFTQTMILLSIPTISGAVATIAFTTHTLYKKKANNKLSY